MCVPIWFKKRFPVLRYYQTESALTSINDCWFLAIVFPIYTSFTVYEIFLVHLYYDIKGHTQKFDGRRNKSSYRPKVYVHLHLLFIYLFVRHISATRCKTSFWRIRMFLVLLCIINCPFSVLFENDSVPLLDTEK